MNFGDLGSLASFSAFVFCSMYTFFFLSNWSRFFSCLVIISSVSATELELISRVDLAIDSSNHSRKGVSSSVYWKDEEKNNYNPFSKCGPTNWKYTVWKFHDFSITQIFREINFWDSRSAKSAILMHFEALNFDFYAFLHLMNP